MTNFKQTQIKKHFLSRWKTYSMRQVDRGNQTMLLTRYSQYTIKLMFQIYILQKLYDVSEIRIITAVIDNLTFSEFCEIDSTNQVPVWDTIGRLRNVLVLVKKRYTRKVSFTFDSTIISTLFTIYLTKPY